MGRHTGPKAKIARRLGVQIFENTGVIRATQRKDYPPGMQTFSFKKRSDYAVRLMEKQKIMYYYGLRDRQLRNLYAKARQALGNTGHNLLNFLERRLDNIVLKLGFATTRYQARQLVNHGHIELNGKRCDIPSAMVEQGDVITVRNKECSKNVVKESLELTGGKVAVPNWLDVDVPKMTGRVLRLPTRDDVTLPVDENMVVEYYSG